jgi:hypothetical protein
VDDPENQAYRAHPSPIMGAHSSGAQESWSNLGSHSAPSLNDHMLPPVGSGAPAIMLRRERFIAELALSPKLSADIVRKCSMRNVKLRGHF